MAGAEAVDSGARETTLESLRRCPSRGSWRQCEAAGGLLSPQLAAAAESRSRCPPARRRGRLPEAAPLRKDKMATAFESHLHRAVLPTQVLEVPPKKPAASYAGSGYFADAYTRYAAWDDDPHIPLLTPRRILVTWAHLTRCAARGLQPGWRQASLLRGARHDNAPGRPVAWEHKML